MAASLALSASGEAAWAIGTTYYVSPNGSGVTCTQTDPCAIGNASVGPGSELVLLPGDYMMGNTPLSSLNSADIHGLAGQPRPRIFSTYSFSAWDLGLNNTNMTFRHIEVYTTGPTGITVNGTGTNIVDDVIISATGVAGNGCAPGTTRSWPW